jgi:hypothetical protein
LLAVQAITGQRARAPSMAAFERRSRISVVAAQLLPFTRRRAVKKLRMDLEALDVETFPVAPAQPVFSGTVRAAEFMATRELYCTNGDTCRTSCGVVGNCTCPPPGN